MGGNSSSGSKRFFGVHETRVKWDKLNIGVGNVVAGDGGLVVMAEPARIEDLGSISRGVGWKVQEVGDGSDDCSNLVGTGEARGKDVVVTCAGTAGFRKHPNENPVRVATVAVCLGDAFFGGGGESSAGCFPIIFHAVDEGFEGLVEGFLNHLRMVDVGVESGLVSEVEVEGGE